MVTIGILSTFPRLKKKKEKRKSLNNVAVIQNTTLYHEKELDQSDNKTVYH